MMLPADNHVHSEWSWDALHGSMERTCAGATAIGLPAVAFTEHADYTTWTVLARGVAADPHMTGLISPDGTLTPPRLDLDGYLESLRRCREQYPDLRIVSGVELGEPHWHSAAVAELIRAGQFDRVLGSLHCLPIDEGFTEPPALYERWPAPAVVRDYLAEIPALVRGSDAFSVLAHLDYPLRYWPEAAGPLDLAPFEDDFRHALRVVASSGRALEINTSGPLHPEVIRWWHDEGGDAVTFGSDAHSPDRIARGFAEATALAESCGFRPGRTVLDFWGRQD